MKLYANVIVVKSFAVVLWDLHFHNSGAPTRRAIPRPENTILSYFSCPWRRLKEKLYFALLQNFENLLNDSPLEKY